MFENSLSFGKTLLFECQKVRVITGFPAKWGIKL